MTILGKFTKQPIEVETYAIQFADDMTTSDSINAGHQVITHQNKSTGLMITGAYTAMLADDHKTIRSSGTITLPIGAPDGYVLYVGNTNQTGSITVGTFNIPARGCAIISRALGVWTVELSANGIIVASAGDQRMRSTIAGGLNGLVYKVELTVITNEGSTMQDELVLKVKET